MKAKGMDGGYGREGDEGSDGGCVKWREKGRRREHRLGRISKERAKVSLRRHCD